MTNILLISSLIPATTDIFGTHYGTAGLELEIKCLWSLEAKDFRKLGFAPPLSFPRTVLRVPASHEDVIVQTRKHHRG